MKSKSLLLCALLILPCCNDLGNGPAPPPSLRPLTESELKLVQSTDKFWLKLFKQISGEDRDTNVFVSPLSISLALGMTLNGAGSETLDSMKATLELAGLTQDEINHAARSLISLLTSADPSVRFQIANSIWIRNGFTVEQEFINTNTTYFDAEVSSLDFASPSAPTTINSWVSLKTNGTITEILKAIPAETVLYLMNAIYFKGNWTEPFDKSKTRESDFTLLDGTTVKCQMMNHGEWKMHFYAGKDYQAADLPYGSGLFSMTIILPSIGTNINGFLAALTHEEWNSLIVGLREETIFFLMPKFTMEYEKGLNVTLRSLGMGIALDPYKADFTGINRDGNLYISNVKHKTFVRVDEEGTEAAAVTAVEIGVTSMPPSMIVNRPFLFFIRERSSGTILFAGKILNP